MPSETLTRGNVVYEKTVCLGNCNEYCYLMSQCLFFLSFLTKLREYSSKQPSFVGSYWMGTLIEYFLLGNISYWEILYWDYWENKPKWEVRDAERNQDQ